MGDAWANGVFGYQVAGSRYRDRPADEPAPEGRKRLRGAIADRIGAMEPPPAQPVQPGGALHVKRNAPADTQRTVRARPTGAPDRSYVADEMLLDDFEQKIGANSGSFGVPATAWAQACLTTNPSSNGATVASRIGKSYILRRICVRGMLYFDSAATSDTMVVRVIVLRDCVTSTGATGTPNTDAGPVFGDGSFYVHDNYHPSNVGDGKRYQILVDRMFNEQKLVSVMRKEFAFCIDVDDEVLTDSGSGSSTPAYIIMATCQGPIQPTLYYNSCSVFVDP